MNNLKFNKEKTVLCATELKYLGHIISSEGSRPDPEKIQAINDMKIQDKKGPQRYLGMVTYVGKIVPNLSEITKPLRDLLQKDAVWQWTRAQDEAVNKINEAITNLRSQQRSNSFIRLVPIWTRSSFATRWSCCILCFKIAESSRKKLCSD
ncbi:polyprotein [Plakobranchus ocellatus]|uniref:Polyprotein n=1 Tax=Plakobranchus ocellatus TaxID=259542 RepID=A0AAV4ASR4_9GAST|nr:polyprotein [Plakobranchus ocellatus]